MFKVWYDICGEYAEEMFDTMAEASQAFDEAVDTMCHSSDYAEIYDLNNDTAIQWFQLGFDEWDDGYDECGFNPYEGCYDYDC